MHKFPSVTTCSVLVATYNRPDVLEYCLTSLFGQSQLPTEIIICDDGSREPTRLVIEKMQAISPVPVRHVWQPDEGFQLARIRNKGIAVASGDYILQIDGDVILHRHFVRDQMRNAKRGFFYSGNQFHLTEEQTKTFLGDPALTFPDILKQTRLTWHRLRVPFLQWPVARFYRWEDQYLFVLGCNMAFWRDDLLTINGYDEGFTGWGWEDTDVVLRLMNLGRQMRFLRFGAIQYHLYHPKSSRAQESSNMERAMQHRDQGVVACEVGLAQYLQQIPEVLDLAAFAFDQRRPAAPVLRK